MRKTIKIGKAPNFKIRLISIDLILIMLLFPFFTINAQVSLTSGLIAYYHFDGNADDATGNGHVGTIGSGITNTTDRFSTANSALAFPGGNGTIGAGDGVLVANNNDLNFNNSYSISLWFKYGGTDNGFDWHELVSKGRDVENSYILTLRPSTSELYFAHSNGDGTFYSVSGIFLGSTNWHLATAVLDKTNNTMSIYIDGQIANVNSYPSINSFINSQNPVSIGYHQGDPGYKYPFDGSIDDVRLYNRALNANEVNTMYTFSTSGVDCSLFAFIKPVIALENNNLKVQNIYSGVNYQWFKNNVAETGQSASIHTASIFNTEYTVSASILTCPALSSEPVSMFKSMETTTVTIIQVITATSCNSFDANSRMESQESISLDIDSNTGKLNINAPAKSINKIEISDLDGNLVASLSQVASIDLTDKPNGTYTIKALNGKGSILKMIKVQLE